MLWTPALAQVFNRQAAGLPGDPYTVGLFKFDELTGTVAAGTLAKDYIKPTRALSSVGANNRNFGKFCGGSIYSDGSGWQMNSGDDPDFKFGDSFSIDFWFYANGTTGAYNGPVISKPRSDGMSPWLIYQNGNTLQLYVSSAGSSFDILNGMSFGAFNANAWNHVALCKQGSSYWLFMNGAFNAGYGAPTAAIWQNTEPVRIGNRFIDSWGGYIDELRFSKGIARWTAAFTPQNEGYFGTLSGGNDQATTLLLHMDGASPSYVFTDSAIGQSKGSPNTFTVAGGARIFGSPKFGSGAAQFAVSSIYDRIYTPSNYDFQPNFGNFTLDFWCQRLATPASFDCIIQKRPNSASITPYSIGIEPGGTMQWYGSQGGSAWDLANPLNFGAATLNTWIHFAMQRGPAYNQFRLFRNGVVTFSNDAWTTGNYFFQTTYPLQIGGLDDGFSANALVDEVRWSAVARFPVAGFTPPAAPY